MTSFILDFDGTLYRLVLDYAALTAALGRGFPDFFQSGALDRPGGLVTFLAAARSRERAMVTSLVARFEAEAVANGSFWDDAPAFLAALRARNVRYGILTRNCRNTVNLAFQNAGLPTPTAMVGLDDNVPPKPDLRATRLLLERIGASRDDVVVIGDTRHDVAVADSLDCPRILRFNPALPRPPSDPRALCIRTFAELDLDRWLGTSRAARDCT